MRIFKSGSFDFNMEVLKFIKILIILKMPFPILSTILVLILVLVSVNYVGNLS